MNPTPQIKVLRNFLSIFALLCIWWPWEGVMAAETKAPRISPGAGLYGEPLSVTISSSTSGAVIQYRTDGRTITASTPGTLYNTPFQVFAGSHEVTAIALAPLHTLSKQSPNTNYEVVEPTLDTPLFSSPAGTYQQPFTLTLTPPEAGGEIRYTTSSTSALGSTSSLYTGPLTLEPGTHTVRAVFLKGGAISPVKAASYTISALVLSSPSVFPNGGSHEVDSLNIYLGSIVLGAQIRYTLDGSEPQSNSPLYSNSIQIASDETPVMVTVKARIYLDGYIPSPVTTVNFSITRPPPTLEVSPASGTFQAISLEVNLSSNSPDDALHYTINGLDPEISSPLYVEPINLRASTTNDVFELRAQHFRDGTAIGEITTETYTLQPIKLPLPITLPVEGTHPEALTAYFGSTVLGAMIRYTLDGSIPNETAEIYSAPIPLEAGQKITMRTRAYFEGYLPSDPTSTTLTILGAPPMPNPPSGIYLDGTALSTPPPVGDSVVRFTLDGSDPDELSPPYTLPLALLSGSHPAPVKIHTQSFAADGTPLSEVARAVYIIDGATYEAWRDVFFEQADVMQPALEDRLWGTGADGDGDGFLNRAEYYAGTNPTDPRDSPKPSVHLIQTDSEFELAYRYSRWVPASDIVSIFEFSTDLAEGHWVLEEEAPIQELSDLEISIDETTGRQKRELRLKLLPATEVSRLFLRSRFDILGP